MSRAVIALLLLFVAVACGSKEKTVDGEASTAAAALEHHHECAACGMVVAEQSVARAQLTHRDGTRQYFCSIGDLMAYLDAPSPHGAVIATHVELQDPGADPREFTTEPRPWHRAEDASYVVGISKERVMGEPVMVYATNAEAAAVAAKYGGTVIDWSALRARKRSP